MPRMSSTSCITGTGFMKCMPMKLLGPVGRGASRVIEIDEVLEARMAPGFRCGISFLKISRFTVLLLGRRLDHEVAVAEPLVVGAGRDALQRRGLVLVRDLAARDLAGDVAVDAPAIARSSALGVDIAEPHVIAGERADMGDAVAHLAGADDADRS